MEKRRPLLYAWPPSGSSRICPLFVYLAGSDRGGEDENYTKIEVWVLMAMARELVQERGIGESADAIWKNLRKQQEEVFNIRSEPIEGREPFLRCALKPTLATLTEPLPQRLASGARCINSRCSAKAACIQKGQRVGESSERQVVLNLLNNRCLKLV